MAFGASSLQVISELCVNLAAAWFAAAFIESALQQQKQTKRDFETLAYKIAFGILFIVLAITIRNFT